MARRKIIIAIDGYSGCGKSSTAKEVARMLGYRYIDTGAMYRAVTLHFLREHVAITSQSEVERALKNVQLEFRVNAKTGENELYLNGLREEKSLRGREVSDAVSPVSALPAVRQALVAQQQRLGKDGAIVMDGRDIGTHVFPDAELKIFMTADLEVRAARRQQEMLEKGKAVDFDEVRTNLAERDRLDTTREIAPLRQAEDAVVLDNTNLSFHETMTRVLHLFEERTERAATS